MLSSECSFTATKPTVEPASIATHTFVSSAAQTSKGGLLLAHTPMIGIECLVNIRVHRLLNRIKDRSPCSPRKTNDSIKVVRVVEFNLHSQMNSCCIRSINRGNSKKEGSQSRHSMVKYDS